MRAVRDCKRYAVEADGLIADARAQFDNRPVEPFSFEGIRRTRAIPLDRVTPEFETRFGNLMRASLLETDQEARIAGMDRKVSQIRHATKGQFGHKTGAPGPLKGNIESESRFQTASGERKTKGSVREICG